MTDRQQPLFNAEETPTPQPVTCLGLTFESNEARCPHFTEELRQKLQDPAFRQIEGFPIGSDENILALSDPPYYTACPNPWIRDFVAEWEAQKPPKPAGYSYHREPFAADVSEGKNDPIYNAHSYHTKVPHKAIMRYILHYTEPGDIVFDGFCGTGMTGVAAQLCGDKAEIESLGYSVKEAGAILQQELDDYGKKQWVEVGRLGKRNAVINDLSPVATFISHNYNTPINLLDFEREAKRILAETADECAWMYETRHTDGRIGRIEYTVWSEVFSCPECSNEIVFLNEALDQKTKKVKETFPCPTCGVTLSKKVLERVNESNFDRSLNELSVRTKRSPVLIVYRLGNGKFEKAPDQQDIELLSELEADFPTDFFPIDRMMHAPIETNVWGDKWRAGTASFTHVHHLFLPRPKKTLSVMWAKMETIRDHRTKAFVKFCFEQSIPGMSLLNRYGPLHFSQVNRLMSGIYYVASQHAECSPWYILNGKIKRLLKAFKNHQKNSFSSITNTGDASTLNLQDNSVDYIFVDPPFGDNLAYAELNFLLEAFHQVFTKRTSEAIVSRYQNKDIGVYHDLMKTCFTEFHRVLKPGHWMTVEFSNTKASIWNSIQNAIANAGFIIANVSALDKQQGSFNAVTNTTSVKQDLVISAYKPDVSTNERFQQKLAYEDSVWDFVRTHLTYLPVIKRQNNAIQFIPERDPRILFDQMVAYYVRQGYPVPLSSPEFQDGLAQRFIERDGMFFLPDQAASYDRQKLLSGEILQPSLFVSDESSAIQWLRQVIREKPQTISDINPLFMQQLGGWSKNEAQLDLRELLAQNFLIYDGKGPVPEQIHAYLSTNWKDLRNLAKDDAALVAKARDRWYVPDPNKAGDLERLRERSLLREFESYKESKKKLRVIRLEAVRAGFKRAWQARDYAAIIAVAERIPSNVLEEDPKLLMWYDQAVTRLGGSA